jgi:phage terminase large subunit-like protein
MAEAGLELDGWQEDILWDGMATLGEDWAGDETAIIVPRQNGKTLALVARALWGPTIGPERLVLFTSHQFKSCREAFLLSKSLCETKAFRRFEPRVSVSHGKEGITFAGDRRLLFIARTRVSGRGFSPDCVVLDEAFELDDMALAALKPSLAAARGPQLWYASSAPHETSTVLRRLAVKGRSGKAERFTYLEWAAPEDAAPDDPEAWALSNPGIGYRIEPGFIRSELDSLDDRDFRRERLGQWDAELGAEWIGEKAWAECTSPATLDTSSWVALGLAGSHSGDTTALVGATITERPHIFVEGFWEQSAAVLDVEQAIREACRKYQVLRIGADPARWSRSLAVLAQEGLPAVEWPITTTRMIPASTRLREAVVNHQVSHSGDEHLARHITNVVVKTDARGSRITRESRYTTRRIDLAVAAVVAHDMAADLQAQAFRVW